MAEIIDKTDIQILRVLQENARITVKDLALKVHLSPTPVFERLHRLENEGYIRKYTAVLDAAKLGRGFLVFCSVRLRRMGKDIANDFVNRVKDIPEVAECYNISGDFDYLLKIYAPDMQYYNNFLINTLGTIDSLGSVQSSFVMSEIKNSCGLESWRRSCPILAQVGFLGWDLRQHNAQNRDSRRRSPPFFLTCAKTPIHLHQQSAPPAPMIGTT